VTGVQDVQIRRRFDQVCNDEEYYKIDVKEMQQIVPAAEGGILILAFSLTTL